ncbi:MAG: hypothetical protein M3P33_03250 [bacterium]|nr:hypothetical protein [bacterium]
MKKHYLGSDIKFSGNIVSKKPSDLGSVAIIDDSDEQVIDDAIMNQQIGVGYSPGDKGFVSRPAYDTIDRNDNDEIIGDVIA